MERHLRFAGCIVVLKRTAAFKYFLSTDPNDCLQEGLSQIYFFNQIDNDG